MMATTLHLSWVGFSVAFGYTALAVACVDLLVRARPSNHLVLSCAVGALVITGFLAALGWWEWIDSAAPGSVASLRRSVFAPGCLLLAVLVVYRTRRGNQ